MPGVPVMIVVAFGLAWWFGLYLIARNPAKPVTLRAGTGLVAYAGSLGCELFSAQWVERAQHLLVGVPALAWTGVLLGLVSGEGSPPRGPDRLWRYGLVPVAVVALTASAVFGGAGYVPAAVTVLVPLGAAALRVGVRARSIRPAPIGAVFVPATLLFGLGVTAMMIPLGWAPTGWLLAGVGLDFAVLGFAIAAFDAFEEGESFVTDLSRSFVACAVAASVIGAQVGLTVSAGPDTAALRGLWLATVATAIAAVVFAGRLQAGLDRVVLAGAPRVRTERDELRSVSEALPRRGAAHLAELDEGEFARLTRQALRHYSDLGKLASNPLVELPLVGKRLAERGTEDHALERARELKALVLECVLRLKPSGAEFGTADEWRHYNALYFFYVVNIRPYRNHPDVTGLDESAREALWWFRRYVPQRTLHNWQQAATRVVAQDLRTRAWRSP